MAIKSKSFGRAFNWIKNEAKPEIINFSNLLIASLAPTIKRELNIPIVVTLQGDDLFINELNNDHRNEVIRELKELQNQSMLLSRLVNSMHKRCLRFLVSQ